MGSCGSLDSLELDTATRTHCSPRAVEEIHSQLRVVVVEVRQCMVQPLNFLLLWSKSRDDRVQQVVLSAQELLCLASGEARELQQQIFMEDVPLMEKWQDG